MAKNGAWPGSLKPSQKGLIAYYPLESSLADASGQHHDGKAVRGDVVYDEGKVGNAAEFSGETQVSFGNIGDFDRGDRFALAMWVRTSPAHAIELVQKRDSPNTGKVMRLASTIPRMTGPQHRLSHFIVRMAAKWPDDAIEVRTKERYADGLVHSPGDELRRLGQSVGGEVLRQRQTGDDGSGEGQLERHVSYRCPTRDWQ